MTLILSVMTKRTVKYFTLVFGIFFYIIANYRAYAGNYGLPDSLSRDAVMSIVLATPVEDEVYTVYGHAAFRVTDIRQNLDVTFNYGIFSFDDGFIWRFVKGETDYIVLPVATSDYMSEYMMRGSNVTELILNMTVEEQARAWNYLLWNIQKENRTYRYNFFYDNCSTRPVEIFLQSVDVDKIKFHSEEEKPVSWRDLINEAERKQPWLLFGTDLALGAPTDRKASKRMQLFLPEKVVEYLPSATVLTKKGEERTIVSEVIEHKTSVISKESDSIWDNFLTPFTVFSLLLILLLIFCFRDIKLKRCSFVIDYILLFSAGVGGLILFFLMFISVHPHTVPNYNFIVLHPFHLVLGIPMVASGINKAYYYHFVNFVVLIAFCAMAWFLPQHFNQAMIPVTLILTVLSACRIFIIRAQRKQIAKS
ncbi:lipoprotein N-acyltransferase Lnb domain-containing protein [Porphyromonas macacae]|uniref:lipoprotein N-acyltransferase Lnb domain-containing protein n=1 Tax=Porphyromonas macacae TaxID=28115 RepID=UPI0035A071BC